MTTHPEMIVRRVVQACADCDICRFLMHEDCLFFPALYRLVDREADTGQPITERTLRNLVDRCTLCGLCPCPNIRNDVVKAKIAYVRKNGISIRDRLLADVQRVGCAGGLVSCAVRFLSSKEPVHGFVKRLAGIHRERRLPPIPDTHFFDWAKARGLCRDPGNGRGVAYFAGCTAGYFFPEVARAAVMVLERSGVDVFVPPQQCCGMPTLVEGQEGKTLDRVGANLERLLAVNAKGYVPVSSCPTCGFLLRVLLREGAFHSTPFQRWAGAGKDEIKIPNGGGLGRFVHLKKSLYGKILADDGLFNALNPMDRIALSEGIRDVGEFLAGLRAKGRFNIVFDSLDRRMVYFAPCHQREQKIGSPYLRLLALIPQLRIQPIGGAMDCCGMGGSLGFKQANHRRAVTQGASLALKIKASDPDAVVTDCLSCRLQFEHLLPYPVFHPLEILAEAAKMLAPA